VIYHNSYFHFYFSNKGIFLALASATCTSSVYFILKKLSNAKVHWACSTIYVCWGGLPLSILLSILSIYQGSYHQKLELELDDLPMDLLYSFFSAFLSLGGQILLTLALIYEDPTKLAVLKTTDVFFACLLQYFLLGIVIDYLAVIGSCSVLAATLTILSFRYFQDRYEDHKANRMAEDDAEKLKDSMKENNGSAMNSCCLEFIFFQI